MKKTFISFLLAVVFFNCYSSAQDKNSAKSIRASFMYIESLTWSPYASSSAIITQNSENIWAYALMFDADLWQLSRNFSAGVHLGFSPSSYRIVTANKSSIGVHYGIDLSYNMLPDCDKWNLSLNASLGSYWAFYKMPYTSYGASLRAEYYPMTHLGIFAELGWGKYHFTNQSVSAVLYGESMAKIGLSYRL
jgi:hypothetical protein